MSYFSTKGPFFFTGQRRQCRVQADAADPHLPQVMGAFQDYRAGYRAVANAVNCPSFLL